MTATLSHAIAALTQSAHPRPAPAKLVEALLAEEKAARQSRPPLTYEQLLGTWQLRFITGTKQSRQRLGRWFGPGFYLPQWLGRICITYELASASQASLKQDASELDHAEKNTPEQDSNPVGQVQNSVAVGPLAIQLTGPTRFWAKPRSLAFDFIQFAFIIGDNPLYATTVKDAEARQHRFMAQTIKDQAFFSYFYVSETAIAARGRGGGLALWTRCSP